MTYYVTQKDGVKIEGLTKEQIYELISGTTGKTPQGVDEAFITKIKEYNENSNASVWIGSSAEYNAIAVKDQNTLYVVIDDTYYEDVQAKFDEIDSEINALQNNMNDYVLNIKSMIDSYNETVNAKFQEYKDWIEYIEENLA